MDEPADPELVELLRSVSTIAVVGIKADVAADAHRVPLYMQQRGYRILPVSPKLAAVLGEPCAPALAKLEAPCELVNLFRAPRHVPAHTDEVLALPEPPRAVWMQLGIRHEESAARLRAAGITVVQDRCLMVEHGRLLAGR
jgi:predicted CoA-binding protein